MADLVDRVRRQLAAAATPAQAPAMQAYMKSPMPFLGVAKPARTAALRPLLSLVDTLTLAGWQQVVRRLWDGAHFREERYAALAVAERAVGGGVRDPSLIALYRDLIVSGAWWDLVDEVAVHLVGPLRAGFPHQIDPVVRAWADDEDLWLRRAAIICQVRLKGATDVDLLVEVLAPNLGDRRFFIAKAVGWALRDYAHTNPDWVRDYVAGHRQELAALSVREATRHL